MSEFASTLQGLATLIGSLVSLCIAIGSLVAAIKLAIKNHKGKIWNLIQEIAEQAMVEAEKSNLVGSSKKEMVINSITASCEAKGINLKPFLQQLDVFIDNTVKLTKQINVK